MAVAGGYKAMSSTLCVCAFFLVSLSADATVEGVRGRVATRSQVNPIRKVVTLLQRMEKKVTEEGAAEESLYKKYMCYCKSSGSDLSATIGASKVSIPEVQTDIEALEAEIAQLKAEIKDAQAGRSEAKTSLMTATTRRESEAAAAASSVTELSSFLTAIEQAIKAIETGLGRGSFLQYARGAVFRKAIMNAASVTDYDRDEVLSFLSGHAAESSSSSAEVVGILKQMHDTFSADRGEEEAAEAAAVKSHEALTKAKKKEIEVLTNAIETKSVRVGDGAVKVETMKGDLSVEQKQLIEDTKFLQDLEKNCAVKTSEWEQRQKTRAEELLAIHETIKLLNDDDALEMFKKTLPSASLLQMKVTSKQAAIRARTVLRSVPFASRPHLSFISAALSGSKVNFEKVIEMIDEMVALLAQEQLDDDNKKESCATQIDQQEDSLKLITAKAADLGAAIERKTEELDAKRVEIAKTKESIESLDKNVAELTENRQAEHAEYVELLSNDASAKKLLGIAKNRLNQFYNPALHKPAPKHELTEEERIYVNNGGVVTTAAPTGIAGTDVAPIFAQIREHTSHTQVDEPGAEPATWDSYQKKGEESTGVMSMIDLLIKELDKEMTEAQTEEKDAQADYSQSMSDSSDQRLLSSKSLAAAEFASATLAKDLTATEEELRSENKNKLATSKVLANLHGECDWLMQNFDVRKEARASESDSLKNAKAVLSGASFSFLQIDQRI